MTPELNFVGPLETGTFPSTLRARVVTPGAEPRIHGYDVESDLARNYRFSELMLLSLSGELPSAEAGAAFDIALSFAAPVSVAHASAHAAVLSRLCGASTAATLGVAATGLGEQARSELAPHAELLAWLDAPSSELPSAYRSRDDDERMSVARFRISLDAVGYHVPALALDPTRMAALLIALHACGLRERERLEACLTLARLPCALAEAFAERVANFREYPVNLPAFRYTEDT